MIINFNKLAKLTLFMIVNKIGVTSIAMDDKTGKITVVGEVDVPVIV